jgi:hypothetical protein
MSRNRAGSWLLLSVLPVWAVGMSHSLDMRRSQIEERSAYGWMQRYAALRPHLEGEPKVTIVYDPFRQHQGNKQLFRAQYVLAPTIVILPRRPLPPVRPRTVPLIYDCHDPPSLDRLLDMTALRAKRRGGVMKTERVARGLAVVWLTERPRR